MTGVNIFFHVGVILDLHGALEIPASLYLTRDNLLTAHPTTLALCHIKYSTHPPAAQLGQGGLEALAQVPQVLVQLVVQRVAATVAELVPVVVPLLV